MFGKRCRAVEHEPISALLPVRTCAPLRPEGNLAQETLVPLCELCLLSRNAIATGGNGNVRR